MLPGRKLPKTHFCLTGLILCCPKTYSFYNRSWSHLLFEKFKHFSTLFAVVLRMRASSTISMTRSSRKYRVDWEPVLGEGTRLEQDQVGTSCAENWESVPQSPLPAQQENTQWAGVSVGRGDEARTGPGRYQLCWELRVSSTISMTRSSGKYTVGWGQCRERGQG